MEVVDARVAAGGLVTTLVLRRQLVRRSAKVAGPLGEHARGARDEARRARERAATVAGCRGSGVPSAGTRSIVSAAGISVRGRGRSGGRSASRLSARIGSPVARPLAHTDGDLEAAVAVDGERSGVEEAGRRQAAGRAVAARLGAERQVVDGAARAAQRVLVAAVDARVQIGGCRDCRRRSSASRARGCRRRKARVAELERRLRPARAQETRQAPQAFGPRRADPRERPRRGSPRRRVSARSQNSAQLRPGFPHCDRPPA